MRKVWLPVPRIRICMDVNPKDKGSQVMSLHLLPTVSKLTPAQKSTKKKTRKQIVQQPLTHGGGLLGCPAVRTLKTKMQNRLFKASQIVRAGLPLCKTV